MLRKDSIETLLLCVYLVVFLCIPVSYSVALFGIKVETLLPLFAGVISLFRTGRWSYSKLDFLVFFFFLSLLYSLAISEGVIEELRAILYLLTALAFSQVCLNVNSRKHVLSTLCAISILASHLYILNPGSWGQPEVKILAYEQRTVFGFVLGLGSAICFSRFLDSRNLFLLYCSIVSFVVLGISGARGAFLVYLITLAILLRSGTKNVKFFGGVGAAFALIGLSFFVSGEIMQRYFGLIDLGIRSSTAYRLDLFLTALDSVKNLNFFGWPYEKYVDYVYRNTSQGYTHLYDGRFQADSDVVRILIRHGLIAFACYSIFVVSLVKCCKGLPKTAHIFVIYIILCSVLDDILSNPLGWMWIGVCLSFVKSRAETVKKYESNISSV